MWTDEVREHLTGHLLPFWKHLRDDACGGFYGYLGYDLKLDKKAVKGCILNSRILWFFSNAYLTLGDETRVPYAQHAWKFLRDACVDRRYGGVYWSVTYDGRPEERMKHTYNQAFAIYALSSYYDAAKDEETLDLAWELYRLIEGKCRDASGYLEAFDEQFCPAENEKLSENGVMAERTMNTLLHVFEAYTELYRVTGASEVGNCLRQMLDQFTEKVYNPELGRQEVFFDRDWHSLIDLYSYGHDIETAWLLDRGCEILGDAEYTKRVGAVTGQITANIYERAYRDHSLMNEADRGITDRTRVWWVQAEAVVGFLNGYEKAMAPGNATGAERYRPAGRDPATGVGVPDSGKARRYLSAAKNVWEYIRDYMVDKRPGSEWFWSLDEYHRPTEKPIVEPWKCPYHNGRMCFEVIRRMGLEKDFATDRDEVHRGT